MSNLQKYSELAHIIVFKNEEYSHVPKSLQSFIEAKNAPILSQMNENSAKNRLKDVLLNLYLANGQNIEDDPKSVAAVGIMRDKIYLDFIKKYPTGTITEFDEALNCGVRGEYEEVTGKLFGGITIVNCNIWAKCYFTSAKRSEAFIQLGKPPVKQLSIEELEKQSEIRKAGFELLRKSFVEPLKQKELEERKQKSLTFTRNIVSNPTQDQKWISLFDLIHRKQGKTLKGGTRFITRYGVNMAMDDFLHRKVEQLEYVKELLKTRNNPFSNLLTK